MAKRQTTRTQAAAAERQPLSKESLVAIVGVCSLILGNIAAILSHIEKIRAQIAQWVGLGDFLAIHGAIKIGAAAAVGIGFGLIAWWVYATYFRQGTKTARIAALALGIAGVPAIGLLTFYAVATPSRIDMLDDQGRRLASTILAQQLQAAGPDDGGFRFETGSAAPDVQAWTSAQCLVALLSGPLNAQQREAAKRGLEYLARTRIPGQGWGIQPGDPRGLTEVNAWVALAEIMSLAPHNERLLTGQERAVMASRIFLELDELVARQNNDGGWGPAPRSNRPEYNRTYSTVMALWAMIEARSSKLLRSDSRWRYDQAINNGATWLIASYRENQRGIGGWYPNPNIKVPSGDFAGLTAQALFVLHRVEDAFPHLGSRPTLVRAQEEFLKLARDGGNGFERLAERDVGKNARAHDSDRYFRGIETVLPDWKGFHAESSTFLWYPWALMALSEIEADEADGPAIQGKARLMRETLLRRSSEAVQMASEDQVIYPSAELLFALNVALSTFDVRETLS